MRTIITTEKNKDIS